jgi:Flp pilus assembly protein TadG
MLTLPIPFPYRLAHDERGISAVEFALVLPLMLTLYLGCVEISDGIAADRKVSLTAATVANLVAQSTTISGTDMSNILDASAAIMQPYSTTALKVTVACLNIDSNKNVTVKWSATRNGSALSGSVSIPNDLKVPNTQLIYTTASYAYTPVVGYTFTGTLTLSQQMYMMPRISAPTYGTTACS